MMIEHFTSDEARSRWRDMVDIATIHGGRAIIERYGKPVAVVIGYVQMNALLQQIQELEAWKEAQLSNQRIESGQAQGVTLAQHEAKIQAQGATDALGDRV